LKKNICALVAYEGTRYLGWQKTPVGPSIQQALEDALAILMKQETPTEAASRTDAGVHAHGQVVNFFVDPETNLEKLLRGLNALLPNDIVVRNLKDAPSSFHPTLDAKAKEYHYEIIYSSSQSPFLRDFSWHYPQKLDRFSMQQAAEHLKGVHDFSSFCNEIKEQDKNPVCHIHSLNIEEISLDHIKIRVVGNRFLYRMVRNLAGTLVYVGCGKLKSQDIPKILKAKDRTLAGITAPAKGLFLNTVYYDLTK
jgi:tRNA pseudouridine38-40 synthase